MTIDQAFILAAGFGSRLRPITNDRPKPLVPVNGRPILDYVTDKLKEHGIRKIVINAHYMAGQIEDYVATLTGFEEVIVSKEWEILDTGGGLKKGSPYFEGEPHFVVSGDSFWDDQGQEGEPGILHRLEELWNPENMDIAMALYPMESMVTPGTGDYRLDPDGRAFRSAHKNGDAMFTSIRIHHPRIFDTAPDGAFSYLDVMDKAEDNGRLYGLMHKGGWYHISTPGDLEAVNAALLRKADHNKHDHTKGRKR